MKYNDTIKNKDFSVFWLTQSVSQIANAFHLLALPLWVLSLTSSAFHTGFTFFLELITMMIFSPFIGVLIDKLNKKFLLIISDFLRAVLILLLLTVQTADEIFIVYLVSILMGLLTTVFNPTRIAFIQSIVGKEQWAKANSLLMLSFSLSMILGPVIGGWLIHSFGYEVTFIVNALSFSIGAIGSFLIKEPLNSKTPKMKLKEINFLNDIKIGFVSIWNLKSLQNILFSQFFVFLGTGANGVLFILVFENYGINSQSIGFFMAAQGIGMALSSLIFPLIKSTDANPQRFIWICTIFMGITLLLFILSAVKFILLGIVFLTLFGISQSFYTINIQTALQIYSDPQLIGRIASTSQLVSRGSMAIATLMVSLFSDMINPLFSVVTGGIILVVSGIILGIRLNTVNRMNSVSKYAD